MKRSSKSEHTSLPSHHLFQRWYHHRSTVSSTSFRAGLQTPLSLDKKTWAILSVVDGGEICEGTRIENCTKKDRKWSRKSKRKQKISESSISATLFLIFYIYRWRIFARAICYSKPYFLVPSYFELIKHPLKWVNWVLWFNYITLQPMSEKLRVGQPKNISEMRIVSVKQDRLW